MSRKISTVIENIYMKDMNVKLKHLICLSIVTLIALQGLSATRLTASNLRRKSTQDKTGGVTVRSSRSSSTVKSTQIEVETLTAGDDGAAKSVGGNSLLPEGFDSADADSEKPSAGDPKVLSAEGLAVKNDIKVEFGEGHGETTDAALKEAMKDVLQKVVGVYVDSDFRVNNDEIIQDEIITHSNGFIDHYKKMDEEDDKNGRGKVVTIKAWVKMRDFVNRMKKISPSQKVKVDGLLLDNELGNKLNAEVLLRKAFKDFDPIMDLMEVNLVDSIRPEVQSSRDDSVVLRYVFAVRYSREKYYKKFLPRVNALLDQIALTRPQTQTVPFKVAKLGLFPELPSEDGYEGIYSVFGKLWKERQVSGSVLVYDRWKKKGDGVISIVQSISKGGVASVREWKLSAHHKKVYDEYRNAFRMEPFSRDYYRGQCVFSLLDSAGECLSQAVVKLPPLEISWSPRPDYEPDFIPLVSGRPVQRLQREYKEEIRKSVDNAFDQNPYFSQYIGCVDITIDKGDVSKIKSAEIKLETNKKESEQ